MTWCRKDNPNLRKRILNFFEPLYVDIHSTAASSHKIISTNSTHLFTFESTAGHRSNTSHYHKKEKPNTTLSTQFLALSMYASQKSDNHTS